MSDCLLIGISLKTQEPMIRNYLLTAWRSINKNKSYTAINVIGLAIGITSFVLLAFYIKKELTMDNFHSQSNSIYRLIHEVKIDSSKHVRMALTLSPMVKAFERDIEGVESSLRIRPVGAYTFVNNDIKIKDGPMVFSEAHLFDFFDFDLVWGDKSNALLEPNTIILSESLARKLFGEEDPMGKMITVVSSEEILVKVTAIVKDHQDTHIRYQAFINWDSKSVSGVKPMDGYEFSVYSYLKLAPNTDYKFIESKIDDRAQAFYKEQWNIDDNHTNREMLQPLKEVYLESKSVEFAESFRSGSYQNIYIMAAVAIFTLLIACINYVNINTARSSNRALEVGVRKILGASRGQLVSQYLSESVLITLISIILSLFLLEIIGPYFNQLTGSILDIKWTELIFGLLIVWMLVSFLSGFYPAFILSSSLPTYIIKGKNNSLGKGNWARQSLITFQFVVSLALISVTIIIYQQIQYALNKPLGFNKEQVLIIALDNSKSVSESYKNFQSLVDKHAGVLKSSLSTDVMGDGYTNNSGAMVAKSNIEKNTLTTLFYVDAHFLDTYQFELLEGHQFREGVSSDSNAYIVNEALVRKLGLENPLGERLTFDPTQPGAPIVGVVKDFHFQAMHKEVQPAVFHIAKNNIWNLSVRINTNNTKEVLSHLEAQWKQLEPNKPFEYSFVDQKFENFYKKDRLLLKSILTFSIVSIIIACLGLYGLTAYLIERKVKEIGIRKVLGANVAQIVLIINLPFVKLFMLALLISTPLVYYLSNQWLENYAYKINISPLPFLLSGALALIITFITISYQSIKAGRSNPTDSLKSE